MDATLSEARVASYEYGDRTVFAMDLGPDVEPSVDIVDDTAIVVLDDGRQREIDLPTGEVQAVNTNGVVTFEVRG